MFNLVGTGITVLIAAFGLAISTNGGLTRTIIARSELPTLYLVNKVSCAWRVHHNLEVSRQERLPLRIVRIKGLKECHIQRKQNLQKGALP